MSINSSFSLFRFGELCKEFSWLLDPTTLKEEYLQIYWVLHEWECRDIFFLKENPLDSLTTDEFLYSEKRDFKLFCLF